MAWSSENEACSSILDFLHWLNYRRPRKEPESVCLPIGRFTAGPANLPHTFKTSRDVEWNVRSTIVQDAV